MLASHNTFTYLKPRYWAFKFFSNFWRCQELSIEDLYKKGVKYIDIRVRWTGKEWRFCHGIVDLQKAFLSLKNLCEYMKNVFPNCYYRIMLERGSSDKFIEEITPLINKYPKLMWVQIKKPWNTVFIRSNHLPCYDYAYENWSLKNCIKSFWRNLIKENRYKNLYKARHDRQHIYFVDYVC